MILHGVPCNLKMSLTKIYATVGAVYEDLTGEKCATFVNQSMVTIMASCRQEDIGNLTTKSMEMMSHFHSWTACHCKNPDGCQCFALTRWHSRQHDIKYVVSPHSYPKVKLSQVYVHLLDTRMCLVRYTMGLCHDQFLNSIGWQNINVSHVYKNAIWFHWITYLSNLQGST